MILLASRSPQRRALLAALGVAFRVVAPRAEEGDDPLANARAKAREVAARAGVPEGGAVLGADTEVILEGRVLGTPRRRRRRPPPADRPRGPDARGPLSRLRDHATR